MYSVSWAWPLPFGTEGEVQEQHKVDLEEATMAGNGTPRQQGPAAGGGGWGEGGMITEGW
jgi:hypothetical protein